MSLPFLSHSILFSPKCLSDLSLWRDLLKFLSFSFPLRSNTIISNSTVIQFLSHFSAPQIHHLQFSLHSTTRIYTFLSFSLIILAALHMFQFSKKDDSLQLCQKAKELFHCWLPLPPHMLQKCHTALLKFLLCPSTPLLGSKEVLSSKKAHYVCTSGHPISKGWHMQKKSHPTYTNPTQKNPIT